MISSIAPIKSHKKYLSSESHGHPVPPITERAFINKMWQVRRRRRRFRVISTSKRIWEAAAAAAADLSWRFNFYLPSGNSFIDVLLDKFLLHARLSLWSVLLEYTHDQLVWLVGFLLLSCLLINMVS